MTTTEPTKPAAPKRTQHTPTKRAEQVKVGDLCESIVGGMVGRVVRIVGRSTIATAVVKWDSGSTGRHTITTLRRVQYPSAIEGAR